MLRRPQTAATTRTVLLRHSTDLPRADWDRGENELDGMGGS